LVSSRPSIQAIDATMNIMKPAMVMRAFIDSRKGHAQNSSRVMELLSRRRSRSKAFPQVLFRSRNATVLQLLVTLNKRSSLWRKNLRSLKIFFMKL
jgi:hypothetical protein